MPHSLAVSDKPTEFKLRFWLQHSLILLSPKKKLICLSADFIKFEYSVNFVIYSSTTGTESSTPFSFDISIFKCLQYFTLLHII